MTPLFLAVYTGHEDVVQALLEANADPMKSFINGSPLHICAERGFVKIAALLIEKAP